jgi:hypothetical protein
MALPGFQCAVCEFKGFLAMGLRNQIASKLSGGSYLDDVGGWIARLHDGISKLD